MPGRTCWVRSSKEIPSFKDEARWTVVETVSLGLNKPAVADTSELKLGGLQTQARAHLATKTGRAALRWKSVTSSATSRGSGSRSSQPSLSPRIAARCVLADCSRLVENWPTFLKQIKGRASLLSTHPDGHRCRPRLIGIAAML